MSNLIPGNQKHLTLDDRKFIEDSLNEVNKVKDEIEDFVFVNEKEIALPNTCYSYIRSFLIEAGLLENLNSSISTLTDEADDFFHALNL